MSNEFLGNYLGVVIQNNDPEKRGRVKVFVPHITNNLILENWSQKEQDKLFNNLGEQDNEDLSSLLAELKKVLPWAEIAAPLFGGVASGRYNSVKKTTYTSHTNYWEQEELLQGNRPSSRFLGEGGVYDGFTDAATAGILNPHAHEYTPSDYSGLAAGTFTIPNVGAHVWVFFQGGDYNCPVYWAAAYGQADYKRIYTTLKRTDSTLQEEGASDLDLASNNISVDHPGAYENSDQDSLDSESKTFRAKHVINTNKHSLEFIDTDHRETLKLTHYSGSFKEWNNYTTTEFAANNSQSLTMGNKFETVRRDNNLYITGNNRVCTDKDYYLRVGNYPRDAVIRVKQMISDLNEIKRLFDTRRTGLTIKTYSGTGELSTAVGVNHMSQLQAQEPLHEGVKDYEGVSYKDGYCHCPKCINAPYSIDTNTWTTSFKYEVDAAANVIRSIRISPTETSAYQALQSISSGEILAATGAPAGIGFYKGGKCDICSSDYLNSLFVRPGYNPSTEFGLFKEESRKSSTGDLVRYYQDNSYDFARYLGALDGGDYIAEIHKNKIETVGMVMNTSPSVRIDPIGKIRAESVFVAPEGVYTSGKPSPHIEPVDVAEVPGGSYILTAGNKLKFIVGAKGINIKTFGPIDMYGTICNIAAEQINIASQHEINLDAGEKLLIRAKKTTIVSKDHEPVLIESPLHVSRNTIIQGGLYVDGEVGVRHITGIREFGNTTPPTPGFEDITVDDKGIILPRANLEKVLKVPSGGVSGFFGGTEIDSSQVNANFAALAQVISDIGGVIEEMGNFLYSHIHYYERLPSKFFDSVESLRAYLNDPNAQPNQATINSRRRTLAAAPADNFTGKYSEFITSLASSKEWAKWIDGALVQGKFLGNKKATFAGSFAIQYVSDTIAKLNASKTKGYLVGAMVVYYGNLIINLNSENPVQGPGILFFDFEVPVNINSVPADQVNISSISPPVSQLTLDRESQAKAVFNYERSSAGGYKDQLLTGLKNSSIRLFF